MPEKPKPRTPPPATYTLPPSYVQSEKGLPAPPQARYIVPAPAAAPQPAAPPVTPRGGGRVQPPPAKSPLGVQYITPTARAAPPPPPPQQFVTPRGGGRVQVPPQVARPGFPSGIADFVRRAASGAQQIQQRGMADILKTAIQRRGVGGLAQDTARLMAQNPVARAAAYLATRPAAGFMGGLAKAEEVGALDPLKKRMAEAAGVITAPEVSYAKIQETGLPQYKPIVVGEMGGQPLTVNQTAGLTPLPGGQPQLTTSINMGPGGRPVVSFGTTAAQGRQPQTAGLGAVRTETEPGIGTMARRTVKELVGGLFESVLVPAETAARTIFGPAGQHAGMMNPVQLPNGKVYVPPITPRRGGGRAGLGPVAQVTLQQAVVQTYGDTPQVRAALDATNEVAYSGPEARMRAIARIIEFGQTPQQAAHGDGDIIASKLLDAGWADNASKAVQAVPEAKYYYDRRKAEGASEYDILHEISVRGLPGEAQELPEAVGRMVFDPLNVVGFVVDDAVKAARAAKAAEMYSPSARTVEEVVANYQKMYKPTMTVLGKTFDVSWAPWVRTPASLVDEIGTHSGNALRAGMLQAAEQGGKEGRPAMQMLIEASVRKAEAAPVAAKFASPAEYDLATAAWKAAQSNADDVLKFYPVMQSDSGKLGANILRTILADENGKLTGAGLKSVLEATDKTPYEKVTELMGKYEDVITGMLLPERGAAKGVAGFVKATGKTAQEFPIFERGFAGAVEKTQVAQAAERAGLEYRVGALDQALASWSSGQGWVNNALWNMFARYNPGYSARNTMNNLLTTIVDGKFTMEGSDVDDGLLKLVGDPIEAARGIGAAGAIPGVRVKPTGGSFVSRLAKEGLSGNLDVFGIPIGAQSVERAFGRRVVYKAAKDYLDGVFRMGKAVPEMPAEVVAALGDDAAYEVAKILEHSYGDADKALKFVRGRGGMLEPWRVLPDDAVSALEAVPGANKKMISELDDLVKNAPTKEAYQKGRDAFAAKWTGKAQAMTDSAPKVFPQDTVERAVLESEGKLLGKPELAGKSAEKLAGDFGIDVKKVAGEEFQARLAADRAAKQLAQDDAQRWTIGRARGLTEADGHKLADAMQATTHRLQQEAEGLVSYLDNARDAAWEQTRDVRRLVDEGVLKKDAAQTQMSSIWADYFKARDEGWSGYRDLYIDAWKRFKVEQNGDLVKAGKLSDNPIIARSEWIWGNADKAELKGLETLRDAETAASLDIAGTPRNKLPQSLSSEIEHRARQMIDELLSGDNPVLYRTEGGFKRTVSGNPQWFQDFRKQFNVTKKEASKILDKIIEDAGADKGKMVERMKETIFDLLERPNPLTGELPDESILAMLRAQAGEAASLDRRQQMNAIEAAIEARVGPLVRPGAAAPEAAGRGAQLGLVGRPETKGGLAARIAEKASAREAAQAAKVGEVADPLAQLNKALNMMDAHVSANWGQARPMSLTPEQWKLAQDYFELARVRGNEAKVIAGRVGAEARDFALLNYGRRYNMDTALSAAFPYQFWYSRTYANWAKRLVMNPTALKAYGQYRTVLSRLHAGLPDYWQQQLSTEDLGFKSDEPLMFNLENGISPLYGLVGSDYIDPNRRRTGLGAFVEDAGSFGPSVWTPIQWGLAFSDYAKGDVAAGDARMNNYLGTPMKALRATTAAINGIAGQNIFPAGGLNLDPQMMIAGLLAGRGLSVQSMTEWERRRVAGIISGYRENVPEGIDPRDWEARVYEAGYLQRGPIWDQAMQEMFANTSGPVLLSYGFGQAVKPRTQQESDFAQIMIEKNNILGKKDTMSAEDYAQAWLDLERRHPEYPLLMLARAPGVQRDDQWIWEAWGRVGVGNTGAWEAAGVSNDAIDAFLKNKSVEGMPDVLRDELLRAATSINAVYRPTTIEEQQAQLNAKRKYKDIQKQLTTEFGNTDAFSLETSLFEIREKQGNDAMDAALAGMSETDRQTVFALWDRRNTMQNADPELARYYSDPERYRSYEVGKFYDRMETQYPDVRDINQSWKELRDEGNYKAADALLKENPQLKEYWAAQKKFYNSELPALVNDWLKGLPQSKQMELRTDVVPTGQTQQELVKYAGAEEQKFQPTGAAAEPTGTEKVEAIKTKYTVQVELAEAEKAEKRGYLTTENRDTYENTLWDNVLYAEGVGGDPKLAVTSFYASRPEGWQVYQTMNSPQELLAYKGGAQYLREKIMTDTGNNWTAVMAYVRSLPPEQIQALKRDIPDIEWVYDHAVRWDDGPSEAARADVVGLNVKFNIDGTISVTRMSTNEYYGGKSDPGEGKKAPAGGGGGGPAAPPKGKAKGIGKQKGAYVETSQGQMFRPVGKRGGSRPAREAAAGQAGGEATTGAWDSLMSSLSDQPGLLVQLQDYFASNDAFKAQMVSQFPNLALYISRLSPQQLAQLQASYLAWAQATGRMGANAQGRTGNTTARSPLLRVYPTRGERTGL